MITIRASSTESPRWVTNPVSWTVRLSSEPVESQPARVTNSVIVSGTTLPGGSAGKTAVAWVGARASVRVTESEPSAGGAIRNTASTGTTSSQAERAVWWCP